MHILNGKKHTNEIQGPNRMLPIMMFTFGSMTLLTVAAKNFGGLMALRWFIGMAESAFFPLVIYYQTTYDFRLDTNAIAIV